MTEIPLVSPTIGVGPASPGTGTATATAPSPQFQQLLEKLQRLADKHREAAPVENADQLREAMRSADDGFVTAMDLRRQLEDAFRRQTP